MSAITYIIIGLAVFLFYLFKGETKSHGISMEIGLAIAFLAALITFDFNVFLQIATTIVIAMLFIQKGLIRNDP